MTVKQLRLRAFLLIFLVLIIDQVSKFIVKTSMYLGQEFPVFGNWFYIHFTENNGMAFGLEFAGESGKLFLSIFRLIAIVAIGYFHYNLITSKARPGLIFSISLILAGAMGNMIDSTFYGMIFSESYHQIATFMPEEGGYAPILFGKVVDMFYFPVLKGYYPIWFPVWGGDDFIFFRPVFNVADAAISTGVIMILIFQKRYFPSTLKEVSTPG